MKQQRFKFGYRSRRGPLQRDGKGGLHRPLRDKKKKSKSRRFGNNYPFSGWGR